MSDGYKVVYSSDAWRDIQSIYSYISEILESEQSAKILVDRIQKSIRGLDVFPERFPLVEWEPWRSEGMHRFPVGNYVVLYLVDPSESMVTVFRIFYGKQDIRGRIGPSDGV